MYLFEKGRINARVKTNTLSPSPLELIPIHWCTLPCFFTFRAEPNLPPPPIPCPTTLPGSCAAFYDTVKEDAVRAAECYKAQGPCCRGWVQFRTILTAKGIPPGVGGGGRSQAQSAAGSPVPPPPQLRDPPPPQPRFGEKILSVVLWRGGGQPEAGPLPPPGVATKSFGSNAESVLPPPTPGAHKGL